MPPSEARGLRCADPRLARRLGSLRSTRALVDLDAVAANFHTLGERAGDAEVLCVVKADAYGHGAVPVTRRLVKEGARWLGVAVVEEGLELREAGVTERILLLGGAEPEQLEVAVEADLTPSIVSHESLHALAELGRRTGSRIRCHLKVDTGMTRLGIPWSELDRAVTVLREAPLEVEGLFTHLASSDDPAVPFTRVQLERFRGCQAVLRNEGLEPPVRHVASSAGLMTRAEGQVELVRPGLALYGLNPFGNVRAPELTPALCLKSRVVRVAEVPAGTAVGYGCTHITLERSVLVTIPVGYGDGLARVLSGDWEVAIGGRLAPLVGRVSMDLVVADVSELVREGRTVRVGDEVVVVGGGGETGAHPVETMAHRLKTIPYEVTCGFSGRVPRVHVEGGEVVGIRSRFFAVTASGAGSA